MSHADNYGAMESRMHDLKKKRDEENKQNNNSEEKKIFLYGITPRENNVQVTYTFLKDVPMFVDGKFFSRKERASIFRSANSDI